MWIDDKIPLMRRVFLCHFTYIGVKEVDAVQTLAPVNAALDAAE